MPWLKRSIFGYIRDKIFEQKNSPFDYYVFPFRGYALDMYLNNQRFSYNE